jgi:predicted O-linked N-acetylglucosamine transferase (SPINDLY family)
MALKLASDPALLSDLRAKLAQNGLSYPLFDTDRFRRHIEAAYITMWERYQRWRASRGICSRPGTIADHK